MENYTYKELKNDLFNSLKRINEIDEFDLLSNGLKKDDIIKDLSKFMIFIEEIEYKKKTEGSKIKEFKTQLLIIKRYLEELTELEN